MMDPTKKVGQMLSLLPEDVALLHHIADREHRSLSEVARDAFVLLRVQEEARAVEEEVDTYE